jgi:glycosyltransferase involved in cell wall biosynthesis
VSSKPSLRILRAADVADNRSGGMSRLMHFGADELRAAGHTVSFLFREQLALDVPFALRRFAAPLRAVAWIRARRDQFDVVEVHEPLAASYARARQRDRSLPPLVVLSHGLEEQGHKATITYHATKGLPFSLKRRLFPMSIVWQAAFAVRHADHVLCSNQDDIDYLAGQRVPREQLSRHLNGVTDEFLALAQPTGEARRGWLFVGSWLVRKGTLDLVPAITSLLRRHRDWHFTAAGTGCDADVVTRAFAEDVRSQVRVLPHIASDQALATLCRQHAVFVLPSVYEGQPLVMFEAAAAEMAIVTTNVCGMKDFIRDGHNGRLVPVGEPAQLERSLEAAMSEAPTLGPRARADVIEGHTWRRSAARLEEAYRAAIAYRR